MTTALALPTDRLRLTYQLDAAVTGLVGVLALESPVTWYDAPGWLVRTVGVLLLVVAVDLAVLSRASGRLLRVGTVVTMELALAWVAATVAVLVLRDVPAAGVEVLSVVGLLTLGFGIAYARLRP
jgi:hypothetical protein